jgi:hypothetical protein
MSQSTTSTPASDADSRSAARWLGRLSILCVFVSCTLNCVFSQLAAKSGTGKTLAGGLVDWSSLAIVLVGVGLGLAGLVGGLKKRSPDTAMIGVIGLVLNLGIVFVVVWYFTMVRPAVLGG